MNSAERAALSLGQSGGAIHALVRRVLAALAPDAGTLVDVGCGTGSLARSLSGCMREYIGCDVVRYDGFPAGNRFIEADLNREPYPVESGLADVVTCVETIEHLENPRLLFRELVRIVRPGGFVILTTPNQLSALAKLSLVVKNQFNSFLDGPYPAHITPIVEMDLQRMAQERGLTDLGVRFTDEGRVPGTGRTWPSPLRGRLFSDNVLIHGRKPL